MSRLLWILLFTPLLALAQTVIDSPADYEPRLADAYSRLDPKKDGWQTEAAGDRYAKILKKSVAAFLSDQKPSVLAPEKLRPALKVTFQDDTITVWRRGEGSAAPPLTWNLLKPKIKVTKIRPDRCEALVTFKNKTTQITTTWDCQFSAEKLSKVDVLDYEEVRVEKPLFEDITAAAMASVDYYQSQLLRSTDHWRTHFPREFGLDAAANHGLALGDVNGDGLDDLYLCQQGGLPNRLLMHQVDGTLRDHTAASRTGLLDYCAAAVFADLDNDGDQDLVVSQDFKIVFYDNLDGNGTFEAAFGHSTNAQSFSLALADYDRDGFLDVFICGYNPSAAKARAGALGEPIPFHDANNGGPNMLWRNKGDWTFEDATQKAGLNDNNTRFSFAAAWADYDQDGDQDLYVANDFGRNNLYRNDNGVFHDVADELQVEDTSAGMSVVWGDPNRDGQLDFYVSNMFSSAGNRITFQNQFLTDADQKVRGSYQRMARGNSLFLGKKDGFSDATLASHTAMARWCWGSRWTDFNNDGWQDLLCANGFITAEDPGDL